MSSQNFTPKRTMVHYEYKLMLELGLDPYEAPEKKTLTYDTWEEVCHGISTHLGQSVDETDENVAHCGKWYVTNHGRGKILQVVDFYSYEYDSDTENEIQQTENATKSDMPNNDQESDTNNDTNSDTDEVEQEEKPEEYVNSLIANFPHYQESAKKCYDEITSCSIL